VAGVIDFVGAGMVHNYFTQGPGNNMQIRSNVDEVNSVGDASRSQWNMVMGSNLDVFSIRRSPAGATYNEDALFWIDGNTGRVGIATVDTGNGATISFPLDAKLHVETDYYEAIRGVSTSSSSGTIGIFGQVTSTEGYGIYGSATATTGYNYGVYGRTDSTNGRGVSGYASSSSGETYGVRGVSASTDGVGVYGRASATSGAVNAVYGRTDSQSGRGVYGVASSTIGNTYGVYGHSFSSYGRGVYGYNSNNSGDSIGVHGQSNSTAGIGVYGEAAATTGTSYGVYGFNAATSGINYGVFGESSSTYGRGVHGEASGTNGYGVVGQSNATVGTSYGVWAQSASPSGAAIRTYASNSSGTNYGVYSVSSSSSGYDFYAGGSGTDYGPFTGAHEVLLSDAFPAEISPGMIVSGTGEAQFRHDADGSVDLSSTMPTVRLADTVKDPAVLGVLVAEIDLVEDHWYTATNGERFASVNALGEGRVWVTNISGEIKAGDYITTSEIPGYGQMQEDDFLHSYTLAKAMETVDWDSVTETVTCNGQEYKVYLLAVVYTSG
jgi:hypothetical protein